DQEPAAVGQEAEHEGLLAEDLAHGAVGGDAVDRVVAGGDRAEGAGGRALDAADGALVIIVDNRRRFQGHVVGRGGHAVGAARAAGAAVRAGGPAAARRTALGRGAGAGVDEVLGDEQATHLGLGGLVEDEAFALHADAVDEAALVGAGVE